MQHYVMLFLFGERIRFYSFCTYCAYRTLRGVCCPRCFNNGWYSIRNNIWWSK
jgi:hypothetical protein